MTAVDDALARLRAPTAPAGERPGAPGPLGDALLEGGVRFAAVDGPLEERWDRALAELAECIRPLAGSAPAPSAPVPGAPLPDAPLPDAPVPDAPVLNEGGVYRGSWIESTGTINADVVVLAAGTGIVPLARALGVHLPIDASPAIFIRYRTAPHLVSTIISNADMEVRQASDGSLLAAEDYVDDAAANQPMQIARRTADTIRQSLRGVTTIEPVHACVGLRPMPADGIPIVGYLSPALPTGVQTEVPSALAADSRTDVQTGLQTPSGGANGVYVCAMHPGVTLAAVVGRLAAEEIVDGTFAPALAPCRPDRFKSLIPTSSI